LEDRRAVRLTQLVAMLFALAAALEAGSVAAASGSGFDVKAGQFAQQLRSSYPGAGPVCSVDLFVDDQGVVYRVGERSGAAGFRLGDPILSLEDRPFLGCKRTG